LNTNGIDFVVNPGVYPPSEDTYLLVDSISLTNTDSFLEIGCGAGLMTVAAARLAEFVVATDVSFDAVRNTVETLERNENKHQVDVFQSDLLTALKVDYEFSIIAFNPPYLPQDDFTSNLDQATIGGKNGIETSSHFLAQAKNHLKPGGRIYLVCSSLADIKKIQHVMEKLEFIVKIVSSKKLFFEELHILEGSLLKSYTETVL
jgi:release factor glutamine methyltransferase